VPALVTAADDRYALPLAVLLRSAEHNLRTDGRLEAYIIDGGIRSRNRRRIEQSVDAARLGIHWVAAPSPSDVEGLPVFGHATVSTYYRVLVPRLLPDALRKAIYVDADCLVTGDIGQLWSMDMRGYPLMAVHDGRTCDSLPGFDRIRSERGLPEGTRRCNGGVLVMDLNQWRHEDISGRILAYLRENRTGNQFWDQDGINAVLATRWVELDQRWNYRVDCFKKLMDPVCGQTRVSDLQRDVSIIHFASATKPWDYEVVHPGKNLFFEYVRMTAWRRWRPRPRLRTLRNRHFYGDLLRRVPLIGTWWARCRARSS